MNQETFNGGATAATVTSHFLLRRGVARIWILNVTATSKVGQLPDARTLPLSPGETAFRLYNVGTEWVSVVDQSLVVIGNIKPGRYSDVLLSDGSTRAGIWWMSDAPIKGGPPPWNSTTTYATGSGPIVTGFAGGGTVTPSGSIQSQE